MKVWKIINSTFSLLVFLALMSLLLTSSSVPPVDQVEQVRAFTRDIEFDFGQWTLAALWLKLNQFSLGTEAYLAPSTRHDLMVDYLNLVAQIQQKQSQLTQIFADPNIQDPQAASQELRQELDTLRARRSRMAPLAEAILQSQISSVVSDLGLIPGGQPLPPVLYHSTPLPSALIVSPRQVIRQDANISLVPDLTVDQQVKLEDEVAQGLDVSTLVVGIGGIGLYPTMVQQTSSLDWLSEVVAHEWVHNFLTLRPLGVSYMNSPGLRTMNETTASIAGKEIGRGVLERYYPELLPPPPASQPQPAPANPQEPPEFNFNKEMHTTRVTVDQMLTEGKVDEAENYMEQRRKVFWEHGYRSLRKLNQAYFAFYGAYADQPGGGAAGEDPVGAAVRQLRDQSPSLAAFLTRMSWMSSVDQLMQSVGKK